VKYAKAAFALYIRQCKAVFDLLFKPILNALIDDIRNELPFTSALVTHIFKIAVEKLASTVAEAKARLTLFIEQQKALLVLYLRQVAEVLSAFLTALKAGAGYYIIRILALASYGQEYLTFLVKKYILEVKVGISVAVIAILLLDQIEYLSPILIRKNRVKRRLLVRHLFTDVTRKAFLGKIKAVPSRKTELERVIAILARYESKNPLLVYSVPSEANLIVEQISLLIVKKLVPFSLQKHVILALNSALYKRLLRLKARVRKPRPKALLQRNKKKRKARFFLKFKKLLIKLCKNPSIIFYASSIKSFQKKRIAASDSKRIKSRKVRRNLFLLVLSKYNGQVIGSISGKSTKFLKSGFYSRFFEKVLLAKNSPQQVQQVISSHVKRLESIYKVIIPANVLKTCTEMSFKFFPEVCKMKKGLKILTMACSDLSVSRKQKTFPYAKNAGKIKYRTYLSYIKTRSKLTTFQLKSSFTTYTGIVLRKDNSVEESKLKNLATLLSQSVIGQKNAIASVSAAIIRAKLGIRDIAKPVASFLFCGPTGVGKTEITKALAQILFEDASSLIRLDMSEYMDKSALTKLIGSAPGLIGYEEGGFLTNLVKKQPNSIVLFDEFEKGHPELINILLQVLDDGRLTDNKGCLVSFSETIIILTSNIGAYTILEHSALDVKQSKIGFLNSMLETGNHTAKPYSKSKMFLESRVDENLVRTLRKNVFRQTTLFPKDSKVSTVSEHALKQSVLKKAVFSALCKAFVPEFLNRLDDIVIFEPLKVEELGQVCELFVRQLVKRVYELKKFTLHVSKSVKDKMTYESYNPRFGARPLRRAIKNKLENLLTTLVISLKAKSVLTNSFVEITLNARNKLQATLTISNEH
jgi:ATP-dependent Clp protease ATP-binding subunit ClpC